MINKIYKSVLITGASSGIGLETLKRFLKENVKVYALDKDVSISVSYTHLTLPTKA